MKQANDPYAILGLTPDADTRAVKHAYRRLVKRYHPDVNPDDRQAESRFKQIQWAYESLVKHQPGQGVDSPGEAFRYSSDFDPSFAYFAAMTDFLRKNKL